MNSIKMSCEKAVAPTFKNLPNGSLFKKPTGTTVYMKTYSKKCFNYSAVSLVSGCQYAIQEDACIIPITSAVTILPDG